MFIKLRENFPNFVCYNLMENPKEKLTQLKKVLYQTGIRFIHLDTYKQINRTNCHKLPFHLRSISTISNCNSSLHFVTILYSFSSSSTCDRIIKSALMLFDVGNKISSITIEMFLSRPCAWRGKRQTANNKMLRTTHDLAIDRCIYSMTIIFDVQKRETTFASIKWKPKTKQWIWL